MGDYYLRKPIEDRFPDLYEEWSGWLSEHFDLGNYDTYKVKDPAVLPYVNGEPQWVTEVFMPDHLVEKLKALEQQHSGDKP